MAKRLDTRFLLTIVLVGMGVAIVAFAVPLVMKTKHGNVSSMVKEANKAIEQGEVERARLLLVQASAIEPANTDLLVQLGDVLAKLTPTDPAYLEQAHITWNKAVSVDPHCVPALERLLASYWDYIEFGESAERTQVFDQIEINASKLLAVQPTNIAADEKRQIAIVRKSLVTKGIVTVQALDRAMKQFEELMKRDPANPDLPYWFSRVKAVEAKEKNDSGQSPLAKEILEDTATRFDVIRKSQPQNGPLHFRAFQAYSQLATVDPRTKDDPQNSSFDRYRKSAHESLLHAQEVATDKDAHYDDIQLAAADLMYRDGKVDDAEKVIRKFYEGHPDNQRARLVMARFLGSKAETREEAIRILNLPMAAKDDVVGFGAVILRERQASTLYQLVMMRLADYGNAQGDAEKQKKISTDIEDTIDKLRRISAPKSIRVLDLQGRLRLARNEDVEGVKLLEEAYQQMTVDRSDFDVMFLLAGAYFRTKQPGAAMTLLEKVVNGAPTWIPPRVELAWQLAQQGNLPAAQRELEKLKKMPSIPAEMMPRLNEAQQLITLGGLKTARNNDPTKPSAVDALPEKTKEEKLTKVYWSVVQEKYDLAIQLLRQIVTEDPKDVLTWQRLASIYDSRGQKDKAKQVLEDAAAANPENNTLKMLVMRFNNAKPDEIYAAAKKMIVESQADEFSKEMQLYDLDRGPGGKGDDAMGHLEKAQSLKPNEPRVIDQLYQVYSLRGDWPKTEVYLKKLVDMNADQCGGLLYRQRYAMLRGDYTQAEDLGGQLVDQYKEFAASWLALSQAQQKLGKYDPAIVSLLEVKKRQPQHYDACRQLIECYYKLSRIEDAKIEIAEARKKFPDDMLFREYYLNHVVNYGNPADAIDERRKMWEQRPDDRNLCLGLAQTYFHAARHEAVVGPAAPAGPGAGAQPPPASRANEFLALAFKTLDTGRQKFPDDPRFYSQMAELYQFVDRLQDALNVVTALRARDVMRNSPVPDLMLNEIYRRANLYDMAEKSLSDAQSRTSDPEQGLDIRLMLAATQVQNKKLKEAWDTVNGADGSQAKNPKLIRQRLAVLLARKEFDKAKNETLRAIADKDSVELRNLLASIQIDTGQVAEAQKQLAAAEKLEPRNETTRFLTALALTKQSQPDIGAAVNELIGLRDRNPRNMQVRLLMAELYSKTGKDELAVLELSDALQKNPLSREVRLRLIELYRLKRPAEADKARELAMVAQRDPALRSDVEWMRQEALCSKDLKDSARAIITYREGVLKREPKNTDFWREYLDMLLEFGEHDALLRESEQLLEQKQDYWWLRARRGLAYLKRANDPKPEEAMREFDAGLAQADAASDSDAAETILRLISDNLHPNGFDIAIGKLAPRIARDGDGRWRLLQAALYRGKNDVPNATKFVEELLNSPAGAIPERRRQALRTAADIYQNGVPANLEKAASAYQELVKLEPSDLAALNNLAYLYAEMLVPPRPKDAKIFSGRAYDISRLSGSPNDLIYDTHGWVLTLCGGDDAIDGLKILSDVVGRKPNFAEGRYHLGVAFMKQPRPQARLAQEEFEKALKLLASQNKDADPALKDKITTALERAKAGGTKGSASLSGP